MTVMCNGDTDILQIPEYPLFILHGGIKHDCVICEWTPKVSEGITVFIPLQLFKSYCAEYDKFYKNNLSHGKNIS